MKLTRVQRKMRRRKIFFTILLMIVTLSAIFILIVNTSFFSIQNIRVLGNNKVLKNKIVLVSSIQEGTNTFKVDTKYAEDNIRKLPYIKSVKIKRKLPKEIIINVVERREIIQIKDISSFIILDKEGYILNSMDTKNEELTEVIGLDTLNKGIGENIFQENEADKSEFILEAERKGIIKRSKIINMEDITSINILFFNNIEVVFGTIDNVKYKMSLLNEVIEDIEGKELKCKMILMDRGDKPIVVLEEEGG